MAWFCLNRFLSSSSHYDILKPYWLDRSFMLKYQPNTSTEVYLFRANGLS